MAMLGIKFKFDDATKLSFTYLTKWTILAILAGVFLDRAIAFLPSRVRTQQARLVTWASATIAILLIVSWPAWQAAQVNERFSEDDVRTQVTQWMEAELPAGSRIVGEYYSPLLEDSRHDFRWVDLAIDLPIAWYLANADYLVLVENRYGGFYLDPSRYPTQIAAYEAMTTQFTLVKEFQGGALGNPCHAKILRVRP